MQRNPFDVFLQFLSWESRKYKNLTILGASIVIAFSLSRYEPFRMFLLGLNETGYIGAFIAGILFVSTFTVGIGAVMLLTFAEQMNPVLLALVAGCGGAVGDLTIFRFVKDNLVEEIKPLYEALGGNHLTNVLHTKYFGWTLPVIGAVIIASPLPDEVGISLMGISRMNTLRFLLLSFILNTTGIFLIIVSSTVF